MQEIESSDDLHSLLNTQESLENIAFQGINFLHFEKQLAGKEIRDCLFLGCILGENLSASLLEHNFIFPSLNVPFPTHPGQLYSAANLYAGYDASNPSSYQDTLDAKVYRHFKKHGKDDLALRESLARRLHDHGITNALHDFLEGYEDKKIVAIMGGHALSRSDAMYRKVATIAAALSKQGFLMVSGGGPGAMEATHLGVWLAGRSLEDWEAVLEILKKAPSYKDAAWLSRAFEVMEQFPAPKSAVSLGIPTWLYGHEPPTPFASHIAKYFANSVREDGLLAIAKGGVIFSPGSAGTIQEIFQDATQNHYLTEGISSPMIFLGKHYWKKEYPIYKLLKKLTKQKKYKNLKLSISNNVKGILKNVLAFDKEDQLETVT